MPPSPAVPHILNNKINHHTGKIRYHQISQNCHKAEKLNDNRRRKPPLQYFMPNLNVSIIKSPLLYSCAPTFLIKIKVCFPDITPQTLYRVSPSVKEYAVIQSPTEVSPCISLNKWKMPFFRDCECRNPRNTNGVKSNRASEYCQIP